MPLFDCKCGQCGEVWEERKAFTDPAGECPKCGSYDTRTLLGGSKVLQKAKDPYEYLNGPIPSSKPIKSFANDRRRGGKNTV